MDEKVQSGGCACGRVRFEADGPAKFVANCWCENCRQAHGAPFVTWVGFANGRFRIVAGAERLKDWATPTGATRSFCRSCGTTLLYRSPGWSEDTHVVATALDEGPEHGPKIHVYADRAPDWCPIHDDLPRYGGENGETPLDGD